MKQRWIKLAEAMESGKYVQNQGKLKSYYGSKCFCAGGLMCELSGQGEWENDEFLVPGLGEETDKKCSYTYAIPTLVMDYYGIPDSQQFYLDSDPNILYSIPCLNDDLLLSFKQIAAIIRNYIED
jgi:hypothetical protein